MKAGKKKWLIKSLPEKLFSSDGDSRSGKLFRAVTFFHELSSGMGSEETNFKCHSKVDKISSVWSIISSAMVTNFWIFFFLKICKTMVLEIFFEFFFLEIFEKSRKNSYYKKLSLSLTGPIITTLWGILLDLVR